MPSTSETPATERHILLVGPYGVLGTGVIDAVAENPKWGIYDLPIAEPLAMSTVSEMSEKAPLWDSMVARYGHVDEVAALVAFVAGPESSYITGANLTVDGGMIA